MSPKFPIVVLACLALTTCSDVHRDARMVVRVRPEPRVRVVVPQPRVRPPKPVGNLLLLHQAEWLYAVLRAEKPVRSGSPRHYSAPVSGSLSGPGQVNGFPCGGDLPACCTLRAESHGIPTAQNPSSSSSGLWQFTHDTWAGYGGYSEAKYAPPAVQNARARQVFAGGRGWAAWKGDGCYNGR